MRNSRLRGLHQLDVPGRIDALEAAGFLDAKQANALRTGSHVLPVAAADAMVENVVGSFGLPLGVAPNFCVDGRDCLVPMVVEEPSVIAALSSAARLARRTGGFRTERTESLLAGQVHLVGIRDLPAAIQQLQGQRARLLAAGNAALPRLVARGGGLRDIEFRSLTLDDGQTVLAVHLLVDTRDAMGANLVNTLCETLAPDIEASSSGRAVLRILSNLADRAIVIARTNIALADLGQDAETAVQTRDGIILANRIARADPYRAATHNKGIMNGIDPLAIATGNDWRAIEAGVHAFAARHGRYAALTDWRIAEDGSLEGCIEVPLKPGIVGGTAENNPGVALCLGLAGARSADDLAALMAAVGLAQNFAALRALVTTGIQAGHMRLHARSVAAAKAAREQPQSGSDTTRHGIAGGSRASGKVILFGEHAVVYGRHALALPILDAVAALAMPATDPYLEIEDWGQRVSLSPMAASSLPPLPAMIATICGALGIPVDLHSLWISTRLPRAMGLGSSAAIAVAATRALAQAAGIVIDDARTNEIAFECEKLAHGTPSGVDNTLACYSRPMLYRRGESLHVESVNVAVDVPLLVACGRSAGHTIDQVAGVRARRARSPVHFERVFDEMDAICLDGRLALESGDYATVGALMNLCHGLLNAIGVSTPELEELVRIARAAGATGAKLTGAGGGGSIVALCPGSEDQVAAAFAAAGIRMISLGQQSPAPPDGAGQDRQ